MNEETHEARIIALENDNLNLQREVAVLRAELEQTKKKLDGWPDVSRRLSFVLRNLLPALWHWIKYHGRQHYLMPTRMRNIFSTSGD